MSVVSQSVNLGFAMERYLEPEVGETRGMLMQSELAIRFSTGAGKQPLLDQLRVQFWHLVACVVCGFAALGCSTNSSKADEGGVSFWLPGFFGSLAATPQQPGWSATWINYYTNVSASGAVSLAREFEIKNIPAGLTATANANLRATGDIGMFAPSYVFATPVLGGQASVSLMGLYGNANTSLNGTISGTLATPLGPIPFMRSDSISSSTTGFGDLYPNFALRWNSGVNNYMAYVTGDVPVGTYSASSLSNIGIGHGAIDVGGGYTYFNPQTGRELSAVLGFTYNLMNDATQYQNGIDMHLDWGASQFVSKQFQVGLVGYFYDQVSCDGGAGDRVGCFQSRVAGIGPQIGYVFPIGTMQGYLNFKGYGEFAAADRPAGWNAWVTFVLSPAPSAQQQQPPIVTK